MISRTLPLAGLGRELRRLGKDIPRALVSSLREAAVELRGNLVQGEIAESSPQPVDQGQFKASWRNRQIKGGAIVFSLAKHALWLERGRGPGKVPYAPIREWVRRKKIYEGEIAQFMPAGGKRDKSGRFPGGKKAAVEKAIDAVAFLVWHSIMAKGYKPRWILKKALVKLKPRLGEIGRKSLAELRP